MKRFSMMVPHRMKEFLDRESERTGLTVSELVRNYIMESPLFEAWLNHSGEVSLPDEPAAPKQAPAPHETPEFNDAVQDLLGARPKDDEDK